MEITSVELETSAEDKITEDRDLSVGSYFDAGEICVHLLIQLFELFKIAFFLCREVCINLMLPNIALILRFLQDKFKLLGWMYIAIEVKKFSLYWLNTIEIVIPHAMFRAILDKSISFFFIVAN